ncbi:MAG: YeeE/YedE thiosulfate transporter family protein [bacterium]
MRSKAAWEWMLAAGVALGSWLSANASDDRHPKRVPDVWAARFGASPTVATWEHFVGGALMMFGARVAKGCTRGHAISGAHQLAASSWLWAWIGGMAAVLVVAATVGARR